MREGGIGGGNPCWRRGQRIRTKLKRYFDNEGLMTERTDKHGLYLIMN